jgi:hypothetical protein
MTTSGARCRRPVVPGLKVCSSHGGATAASVRKSTRAKVEDQVHSLWGIAPGAGSISVEEELTKLFRNKLADVTALRLKISADEQARHIGHLRESRVENEYDIQGTVQSKTGTSSTVTKRAGVSVWVQELHKAEAELLAIARLLHEVTGGTDEFDTKRLRMQTAREAARLSKAFPGMSADDIALEIAKKAS